MVGQPPWHCHAQPPGHGSRPPPPPRRWPGPPTVMVEPTASILVVSMDVGLCTRAKWGPLNSETCELEGQSPALQGTGTGPLQQHPCRKGNTGGAQQPLPHSNPALCKGPSPASGACPGLSGGPGSALRRVHSLPESGVNQEALCGAERPSQPLPCKREACFQVLSHAF